MLFLLVLFHYVCATPTVLALSDLNYATAWCQIAGRGADGSALSLLNHFGNLTLDNDLMGTQMRVRFQLDPTQRACRFCAMQQSYCFQSFGAPNSTDVLHLASDTSYNLRILSLDGGASQSLLLPAGQMSVSLATPGQRCGQQLRLVIQAMLTAESPAQRDFFVQARDRTNLLLQNCSQTLSDLSCRLAPQYFYVNYSVDNCVASVTHSAPLAPVVPLSQQRSYVWQYYQAVAVRDTETRNSLAALSLCGESWLVLVERARLEIYCDLDQALFIAQKPWYRVAFSVTAVWLSGRRDLAVQLALEQLERLCVMRDDDSSPVTLSNWSRALMEYELAPLPPEQDDWAALCEWALQLEPGPPVGLHTNVSLPYYWTHEDDWYWTPFLYVIYYNDPWMGVKAALLVTMFVLSGLTVTSGLLYVLFLIWRHHRQRYHVV